MRLNPYSSEYGLALLPLPLATTIFFDILIAGKMAICVVFASLWVINPFGSTILTMLGLLKYGVLNQYENLFLYLIFLDNTYLFNCLTSNKNTVSIVINHAPNDVLILICAIFNVTAIFYTIEAFCMNKNAC